MQLPLENGPGTSLPQAHVDLFRKHPTVDVTLADGTAAIAVTRQCDVRTVLSDNRFSRAQFHMRTVCAGSDLPLALVTSDPPIHTLRRQAIQGWFTARKAEQARPLIERVADQLIDDLLTAGPPADIYARFCQPFPNLVHMKILGLDTADLPYLAERITVAWSAGHYRSEDVTKANLDLREYFERQVSRSRRRTTSGELIDALVRDESAGRLTDAEIVMLSMGLFMSGAETTSSHLALSLVYLLQQRRPDRHTSPPPREDSVRGRRAAPLGLVRGHHWWHRGAGARRDRRREAARPPDLEGEDRRADT